MRVTFGAGLFMTGLLHTASIPARQYGFMLALMSQTTSDLPALLHSMAPVMHPGVYAYASLPPGADAADLETIASMLEPEGLTVIVTEAQAIKAGLAILFRASWITLQVHSDLQAVGLTAAVATALSQAGISCNVVAGAFHDHLFVPVEAGEAAMAVLKALQQSQQPT